MSGKSSVGDSHAAVFIALALGTAMCIVLVAGRSVFSHTHHLQFLIWNLFLA